MIKLISFLSVYKFKINLFKPCSLCCSVKMCSLTRSSANESDGDYALPLVKDIYQRCLQQENTIPENWIMDSGYDRENIYQKIYDNYNGQAFIPINKRNAKEPPAGFYDYDGTPACSCGYKMVYWGCEKDFNKFRCPHVMNKVDCPYGSAWCSDSNYGYVKKTRIKDNPRFISTPHRGTKNWIKILGGYIDYTSLFLSRFCLIKSFVLFLSVIRGDGNGFSFFLFSFSHQKEL